jgi:hypothetical protein
MSCAFDARELLFYYYYNFLGIFLKRFRSGAADFGERLKYISEDKKTPTKAAPVVRGDFNLEK